MIDLHNKTISSTIYWNDTDNELRLRPGIVSLTLTRTDPDSLKVKEQEIKLHVTASNTVEYTFKNQDAFNSNMKPYVYLVKIGKIRYYSKEPTQTEEGIEKQSCTRCEAENTLYTAPGSHEHNYEYKVIKEPTCTEDGIRIYACTICGEDNGQQWVIDAHHTWGEWEITKDAGTEAHTTIYTDELPFGERERECSICHEKQMQYIINIDASAYDAEDIWWLPNPNFISENIAQVYGTFHDDMAYETLEMVNDLRKSLGKSELKWNNGFRNMGKIRSAEIHIRFSHTRPSGMFVIPAENILCSGSICNAQEAFDGWYNSPGHYQNMINDYNNNLYYASCFEDAEYGSFLWVQLFY